jgi:amidase
MVEGPIERKVMSDELYTWSASRLAKAIAGREVSAQEALASSLERIDAVNPALNAVVDVYHEEAVRQAEATDQYLAAGFSLGPLGGVPTLIKDNVRTAGHPATNGIPSRANILSPADDPVVENIRRGGANVIGRTNVPPWCWEWFCTNELWGTTFNARNHDLTPGGSSGGAGSAVAAGIVPIAHGNDIAGSVRYPAYANGIVGLRPTVGAVPGKGYTPEDPALSVQLFAVQGPLARTVQDAKLGFDVMRGYSWRDPVTVPQVDLPAGARRVGVYRGTEITPLAPEVGQALDAAIVALESRGYVVEEIKTDVFQQMFELEMLLTFQEFVQSGSSHIIEGGEIMRKGLEGWSAVVEDLFGTGFQLDLKSYGRTLARRGTVIRTLQGLLERTPIILTPSSAEVPFLHDEDQDTPVSRKHDIVLAQWPMCGTPVVGFPGLVVPTNVVAKNVPLGVHLISRRFGENDLFAAGQALEDAFGPASVS